MDGLLGSAMGLFFRGTWYNVILTREKPFSTTTNHADHYFYKFKVQNLQGQDVSGNVTIALSFTTTTGVSSFLLPFGFIFLLSFVIIAKRRTRH